MRWERLFKEELSRARSRILVHLLAGGWIYFGRLEYSPGTIRPIPPPGLVGSLALCPDTAVTGRRHSILGVVLSSLPRTFRSPGRLSARRHVLGGTSCRLGNHAIRARRNIKKKPGFFKKPGFCFYTNHESPRVPPTGFRFSPPLHRCSAAAVTGRRSNPPDSRRAWRRSAGSADSKSSSDSTSADSRPPPTSPARCWSVPANRSARD